MTVQDSVSQIGKIIHQQIFSNNVMLVFWYNENAREATFLPGKYLSMFWCSSVF